MTPSDCTGPAIIVTLGKSQKSQQERTRLASSFDSWFLAVELGSMCTITLPEPKQADSNTAFHGSLSLPPQICWSRTSGIGAQEYEFYKLPRLLWCWWKFTKHWLVIAEVSSLLGFFQWKYSQWEHSNEQLCWSHKLPHAKGVLIGYCDLEIHQCNLKVSRQKDKDPKQFIWRESHRSS